MDAASRFDSWLQNGTTQPKNRRTAHVCKNRFCTRSHIETTFRLVVLSRNFARNDKIPRVGLDVFPRVTLFGNDYSNLVRPFA